MKKNALWLIILALGALGSFLVALRMIGAGQLSEQGGGAHGVPVEARNLRTRLYAADPNQMWNRLHNALRARVGPDGKEYGAQRLDPLLWSATKHLRKGPSYEKTRVTIEEFLSTHAERQIGDTLKRAMFQRDLWAVFDWYVSWYSWYARQAGAEEPVKPALAVPLAEIIRRVALTPQQIQSLPDNYSAAIASKAFPGQYDPRQPKRPFLPPDLLRTNSPWVRLGQQWGDNVARQHMEELGGRSVFLVFVRLPEGRQATLRYLEQAKNIEKPNDEWPQFPVGTQFALVRRMLLVDTAGHLQVSPLVESVQMRVYLDIPEKRERRVVAETLTQQAVFEFVLDRAELFRGEAGGLRAVDLAETDFSTFQTHGLDPFEPGEQERPEFAKWQHPVLSLCAVCHSGSGVISVNSRLSLGTDDDGSGINREAEKTMYWKQQRYEWGLLQGVWYGNTSRWRE